MKNVDITMYYWGGEKYGIKIKTECGECGINAGILRSMEEKEFKGRPVTVTIKPWLTNFWTALFHGGWHAPIITVNGKVISQGIVVDREKLAGRVEALLAK